jgi:hypothetical protein
MKCEVTHVQTGSQTYSVTSQHLTRLRDWNIHKWFYNHDTSYEIEMTLHC